MDLGGDPIWLFSCLPRRFSMGNLLKYLIMEQTRDFTNDDIVEGIIRVLDKPAISDPSWTSSNPKPNSSNCLLEYTILEVIIPKT